MIGEEKNICMGDLDHRIRQLSVDCSGCKGPRSLSERVCFMGLAARITPGFTGEVVLRSGSDRMHRGPLVEALSACSEIMDMIASLAPKGSSKKARHLKDEIMSSFVKDPRTLLSIDAELVSGKVDQGDRARTIAQLTAISDRTRRMIARLEG
jgi:hypothetical protein